MSSNATMGNTLDSHKLIYFAGQQGLDKQQDLVDELCLCYFTYGKYSGNREFLGKSAKKVGVEGAAEFLEDPNNGLKEVLNAAWDVCIPIASENAISCLDRVGYNKILDNANPLSDRTSCNLNGLSRECMEGTFLLLAIL